MILDTANVYSFRYVGPREAPFGIFLPRLIRLPCQLPSDLIIRTGVAVFGSKIWNVRLQNSQLSETYMRSNGMVEGSPAATWTTSSTTSTTSSATWTTSSATWSMLRRLPTVPRSAERPQAEVSRAFLAPGAPAPNTTAPRGRGPPHIFTKRYCSKGNKKYSKDLLGMFDVNLLSARNSEFMKATLFCLWSNFDLFFLSCSPSPHWEDMICAIVLKVQIDFAALELKVEPKKYEM